MQSLQPSRRQNPYRSLVQKSMRCRLQVRIACNPVEISGALHDKKHFRKSVLSRMPSFVIIAFSLTRFSQRIGASETTYSFLYKIGKNFIQERQDQVFLENDSPNSYSFHRENNTRKLIAPFIGEIFQFRQRLLPSVHFLTNCSMPLSIKSPSAIFMTIHFNALMP